MLASSKISSKTSISLYTMHRKEKITLTPNGVANVRQSYENAPTELSSGQESMDVQSENEHTKSVQR